MAFEIFLGRNTNTLLFAKIPGKLEISSLCDAHQKALAKAKAMREEANKIWPHAASMATPRVYQDGACSRKIPEHDLQILLTKLRNRNEK